MIRCLLSIALLSLPSLALAEDFASDFQNTPDRVWIGSDYWANPMEDWSVTKGKLVCRGGGNRNLALLTRELSGQGAFEMSVTLDRETQGNAAGTAGFRIGLRDELPDYRAAVLRGNGIDIGIESPAGRIFIGKLAGEKLPEGKHPDEVTLNLSGKPAGEEYELTLTALDKSGKSLAVAKAKVAAAGIAGPVALVNNHAAGGKPGFWFSNWKLSGAGVTAHQERSWGPILWTMHTLHHTHSQAGAVLKLSAQLVPLGEKEGQTATLKLSTHEKTFEAKVDPLACTAIFRIENWDVSHSAEYTVQYAGDEYQGTIRREPAGKPLVVAGFTGNTDYIFPNSAVVGNVTAQNSDVLFFSGDQIYEQVGDYGIVRAPTDTADEALIRRAVLNYLRKWYLLGWAFGDLMRDRPTVCLPDDHDVYQGNIWGEGGLNPHGINNHAKGGFAEHPTFVNAVFRTQCGHHPDLPDPKPMEQGIDVFFGDMLYGRVSFAMLEDRYFKSGPEGKVDTWKGRPDHMKNPDYDISKLDQEGLELLGKRQEEFLQSWAGDWRGADFKCVLSQTIFCNLANYHGPEREFIFADLDSNGWPQTARNNALRIMRKGYAFHYAGDQHLPSISQYGIDAWGDAGFAFCVPSIAAGYPRSWLPDKEGRPVQNRPEPGLANTGEYRDGFGNYVTVYGIGNPEEKNRPGREKTGHDKASGHGIVRFDSSNLTITIECYRLLFDPQNVKPEDQFPGWPKTIKLAENRGQKVLKYLPEIKAPEGVKRPVLRLFSADSGELVYALRIAEPKVKPWIYSEGKYRVQLGDPDANNWTTAE